MKSLNHKGYHQKLAQELSPKLSQKSITITIRGFHISSPEQQSKSKSRGSQLSEQFQQWSQQNQQRRRRQEDEQRPWQWFTQWCTVLNMRPRPDAPPRTARPKRSRPWNGAPPQRPCNAWWLRWLLLAATMSWYAQLQSSQHEAKLIWCLCFLRQCWKCRC